MQPAEIAENKLKANRQKFNIRVTGWALSRPS
ncbi:MAG: hypothetical protein ACI9NY_002138 [Kiritimatiellia bacterium]